MPELSGQQKADQNLATFLSWAASKTDADYREMVMRGQLNRKEIARECGFAKSVLLQNPRVKDALRTLEAHLRERDILPLMAGKKTVYRLAQQGEIPGFKLGGTWRFRRGELDRWIAEQIAEKTQDKR